MSEREARRKLLLLKGALYRLEISQARHSLREEVSRKIITDRLPGVLKSVLNNNRAAILSTVVPLLFGGGRLRRYARRALLAAGGLAAAWSLLKRLRSGAADATAPEGSEPGQ
jgi:hypothetical protein